MTTIRIADGDHRQTFRLTPQVAVIVTRANGTGSYIYARCDSLSEAEEAADEATYKGWAVEGIYEMQRIESRTLAAITEPPPKTFLERMKEKFFGKAVG